MIKWQYLLSENAKLEEYFKFSLFPLFSLQNKVSLLSACFLFFIIFFFPHHLSKKGHFASLFFLKLCIHTNTAFELRHNALRKACGSGQGSKMCIFQLQDIQLICIS